MNKELIKLSENLGAVTNECGDVKIVEVNQNSKNLEIGRASCRERV